MNASKSPSSKDYKLISSTEDIKRVCDFIQKESEVLDHPFVALDTEFLREKTYWPQLCLIQIGFQESVWIIDPLLSEVDLSPFWEILKNRKIMKVLHSARQDLEIFYHMMGSLPEPLFDTQIAAMVCGYQESVGYEALVKDFLKLILDKSSRRTDWSQRSLSPNQLAYAAADVRYLAQIYPLIYEKLTKQNRLPWIEQETGVLLCKETYETPTESAYLRLKMKKKAPHYLAALRLLAGWREEEAKKRNRARSFVLKDDTLQDFAIMNPKTEKEALRMPSIKRASLSQGHLKQILSLLEEARKTPPDQCPTFPNVPAKAPNRQAIMFLKLLLSKVCLEQKVAEKLVVTSQQLETYVLNPENQDHPLNQGWRRTVFGQQADALLKGNLMAVFEGQQLIFKHKTNLF